MVRSVEVEKLVGDDVVLELPPKLKREASKVSRPVAVGRSVEVHPVDDAFQRGVGPKTRATCR
jgi:hypothetical protein